MLALGFLTKLGNREVAGVLVVVEIFVLFELFDNGVDYLGIGPEFFKKAFSEFADGTRLCGEQLDGAVQRSLARAIAVADDPVCVIDMRFMSSPHVSQLTMHNEERTIVCHYLWALCSVHSKIYDVDGVLVIDKPAGLTSHDVVARVRRVLKTKRVGHTGTLDPFATGVLVLLVGKATRLAQFVNDAAKEYVAAITFGFATDTGDVTGTATSEKRTVTVAPTEIEAVLPMFRGEIEQVPPMYSAKKVEGKRLYELARRGETIERQPIKVTIYELTLPEKQSDSDPQTASVRVTCSAGTYIRTLAEDIGKALGVGAHLTCLRRTAAGRFDLRHAITLDELEKRSAPWASLLPWDRLISHLPQLDLPAERVGPTASGLATRVDREDLRDGDAVSMFDSDGNLIAVGVFDASENFVRPKVVLV